MRNNWYAILSCLCLSLGLFPKLKAQVISGNAFMQGTYVEIGIAPCGSFGSSIAPPTGFHPTEFGLGFVADADRDGWNTGSPNYCGDYFLPGTPEEGWAIQIDGIAYNNNQVCSEEGIIGSISNYSETSDEISVNWEGAVNGLSVRKEVVLPVDSLYFISTVTLTNTTSDTLRDVYYMRNVDPDQEQNWSGDYATTNAVVDQNPNPPCNVALVSASGGTYGCYLGLGTKHADARVTIGGFSNRSPYDVWHGVGELQQSGSITNDVAISLAFNLGDLAPGERKTFAYAYVLSGDMINSALNATDLNFNVSGASIQTGATVPTCSGGDIPLTIENAGSYTWNWSPSAGLNTTTGANVIANVSTPTTYTATGTGPCGTVSLEITLDPQTLPTPSSAGSISGPSSTCPSSSGIIYSVDPIANATEYHWTVPAGATILAGEGTTSIEVLFGNSAVSGNISVRGSNVCAEGDSSTFFVALTDNTPPTVATQNIARTLDANGELSLTPAEVFLSGTDNCSGTINLLSVSPNSFTCADVGNQTVTLTFDDGNGNVDTASATVTISENTQPVPDLVTLSDLTADCSLTISTPPTATDNCSGAIQATTLDPLTYDSPGTYTITWTYDDGNGNSVQQTQQVIIDDQTAPTPDLSVLPTLTAACSLTISAPPTATDNCDGTITAITADPLTYEAQGAYVVDWVYEDAAGNLTTQVQHVIIEDDQAPVPDQASLPTLRAACELAVSDLPTATDNCGGLITATTQDELVFAEQGSFTIEWTYEDQYGNISTQTQAVEILDEEAPAPIVTELPKLVDACGVTVVNVPTAIDNCDGLIQATTEDPLVYQEQGEYTITWRFDDSHGNFRLQSQTVLVKDKVAPVPDVASLEPLTGSCLVVVPDDNLPTATDNCGSTIVGVTIDPLVYEEQGTYQVVWRFLDENGNASQQIQEVIVSDQSAPIPEVANLPTLQAACGLTVNRPVAIDDCDGTIFGSTTDALTYEEQGTFEITWTYEDRGGNRIQQTQQIIIRDEEAPTFAGPADVVTCDGEVGDLSLQNLNDNCTDVQVRYELSGATLAQGEDDASGATFNPGETEVHYVVTDQNGNQSEHRFTVTREALQAEITQEAETLTATEAEQYQWIDCQTGNAIAQATQRSFAPTESGQYAVVISSATCSDTSACVAFATTSVAAQKAIAGLRLYPNPTEGQLTLELSDLSQAATLILVDATGREVLRRSDLQQPRVTLDLSDLSQGVYFARVQQGSQQSVIRVLRR